MADEGFVAPPVKLSSAPEPHLLPQPTSMRRMPGHFELSAACMVRAAEELQLTSSEVTRLLETSLGFSLPQTNAGDVATLRMQYDAAVPVEGYSLKVDSSGIELCASGEQGVFYALQTLRQLMPCDSFSEWNPQQRVFVPAVEVADAPRFGWRGLHLDVSRHFMPVAFIYRFIDLLAAHKLNRFHWHLTDDQGWRIEIKRYPKLTEVGSRRTRTAKGRALWHRRRQRYDETPHAGFYTQDDIKAIVHYAAQRHVTVVPEIEFPGHSQAAIAAYPELGSAARPVAVKTRWGISEHVINPSDEALQFYRHVLDEVMQLFPSHFIHIGGDEASTRQWRKSAAAQARMNAQTIPDEHALKVWLINQLAEHVASRGRQLIGWDDICHHDLAQAVAIMSWRGQRPGVRAASAGHDVVMAPNRYTYLDYYQGDPAAEPLAIGPYLPLAQAYAFEPIPEKMPPGLRHRVLGAQGQLWTEFMRTPQQVEYMAFPRACALAEVLWNPGERRDYEGFLRRLRVHLRRLDVLAVNYRPLGSDALGNASRVRQWLLNRAMSIYFRLHGA